MSEVIDWPALAVEPQQAPAQEPEAAELLRAKIEAQVDAERKALDAEAESLGVRLPSGYDHDDYSITIGLTPAGVSADEKAAVLAVTFAEPEPDAFETLVWHDARNPPSTDRTVMCWGSEGFFCGYFDYIHCGWIGCESGGSVVGVTHWSEPKGPLAA